jgi:hypothetical protein
MNSLDKISVNLPNGAESRSIDQGKVVYRRSLVNKLNHLNFQDRTIIVNLRHRRYDNTISLTAKPLPCSNDHLRCTWNNVADLERILTVYSFANFLIDDGKNLLLVEPEEAEMSVAGIGCILPETCREVRSRETKRHRGKEVTARLLQNGAEFQGVLKDFSAVAFCVDCNAAPPRAFHWIDFNSPVYVGLSAGQETFFSGQCRIIRHELSDSAGTFALEPQQQQLRRFKPKEYRTERQVLVPSPNIEFSHPLINRKVSLKVINISGSGMSVEEDAGESVLVPGLIIPELAICCAGSVRLNCATQVVYRKPADGEGKGSRVKCGLAILDMDVADHVRLIALLHQASDSNSYLCPHVDKDDLWQFFFETGFLYPEKYAYFQADKEEIKLTFDRLYNGHPGIGRHFICQQNGKILGHMAMLRFFSNSWLIHHHAAIKSEASKAGLIVLNQISRYVNDIHHLRSAHMKYVFCYFRPENRFPNRVFGEFAHHLNQPQGCSLDTFAYFHFERGNVERGAAAGKWELADTSPEELDELKGFYRQQSGGLMLDAFDLGSGGNGPEELASEYKRFGFRKERHLLSLRQDGVLKALIMANVSDVGLNMSDLTSSATVLVLDESLPRNMLEFALSSVADKYERKGMPVLLYPVPYAEKNALPSEKMYTLWVLDLQYLDPYFKFCDAIFNTVHKTV